jgi:hypothetical protein
MVTPGEQQGSTSEVAASARLRTRDNHIPTFRRVPVRELFLGNFFRLLYRNLLEMYF